MSLQTGLEGQHVLITGASGGIGRALAEEFGEQGCELTLVAGRRTDALTSWCATRPWNARARVVGVDLRDHEAMATLFADRRVDVVVANAGIWPPEAQSLADVAIEEVERVLDINLRGTLWTARAFVRSLARLGPRPDGSGASLCLIGSTAARFGEAGHLAYSVSKAGLYGLLRSLKNEIVELDPNARVNLVEPGWTATPMAADALKDRVAVARAMQTRALAQVASARDIANAVLFLSAPALSGHITGEILTVAGGMEGRVLRVSERERD